MVCEYGHGSAGIGMDLRVLECMSIMLRRITNLLNDLTMQRVTPEVNSTRVSEQRM
jgi:hypothetical protein